MTDKDHFNDDMATAQPPEQLGAEVDPINELLMPHELVLHIEEEDMPPKPHHYYFPNAIVAEDRVMEHGKATHPDDMSWLNHESEKSHLEAIGRHEEAYRSCIYTDKASGQPVEAHIISRWRMILEKRLQGKL